MLGLLAAEPSSRQKKVLSHVLSELAKTQASDVPKATRNDIASSDYQFQNSLHSKLFSKTSVQAPSTIASVKQIVAPARKDSRDEQAIQKIKRRLNDQSKKKPNFVQCNKLVKKKGHARQQPIQPIQAKRGLKLKYNSLQSAIKHESLLHSNWMIDSQDGRNESISTAKLEDTQTTLPEVNQISPDKTK